MANVVKNKLTILGPQNDIELLRQEIAENACPTGGYHDLPCILHAIRDLREAGQVVEFETYWKPPYPFLRDVPKRYPRLVFCLSFLEEDCWYGRLIFWRSRCVACEEYEGGDRGRSRRMFKSHRVVVGRGRKLFETQEDLRPEWLEGR